MNSLERKLQKCEESKQLIRKLIYKDYQVKSQKLEYIQLKDDIRTIDEICLQLYGLVKRAADQLGNYNK